jgi:hypothetical protein
MRLNAEATLDDHKELPPTRNVYKVIWTFSVAAESQEEANESIKETMTKFTEMMGWKKPEDLIRLRQGI